MSIYVKFDASTATTPPPSNLKLRCSIQSTTTPINIIVNDNVTISDSIELIVNNNIQTQNMYCSVYNNLLNGVNGNKVCNTAGISITQGQTYTVTQSCNVIFALIIFSLSFLIS